MKIFKILKESIEARVVAICLLFFVLFGFSFANLGIVSAISFWICVRFIPIAVLIRFFVETVISFSKAVRISEDRYKNIAFSVGGIAICSILVWILTLPNTIA